MSPSEPQPSSPQPSSQPASNRGQQHEPKARYGKQRNGTFTGKILAIIFAAMAIAVVVYMVSMFRNQSNVDVSAVESGGEIVSDSLLKASVDITRDDPSKAAYCVIYALDYEKNEVGRREVMVPAGGQKTVRYELEMPTIKRAHAAKVYGCSSTVPSYLDQNSSQQ